MTDKEKDYLDKMLKNGSTIRLKDIAYKDGQPPEEDDEPDENCCGDCCWFYGEETNGWGLCAKLRLEWELDSMHCSDMCEDDFVSRKEMRHHMAVLLQHNRWRKSDLPPGQIRQVDPFEVGFAIDFAYKYMKVFSDL